MQIGRLNQARVRGVMAVAALLFFVGGVSAVAQIYPERTALDEERMEGAVRQVIEHARSWSAELDRWNPLAMVTSKSFMRDGRLRRETVIYHNETVDDKMYVYDSASGTAKPVSENTIVGTSGNGAIEIASEKTYGYSEDGKLQLIQFRDYRAKRTTIWLHVYDTKGRLKMKVKSDSADGYIREIEEYYWMGDDRPTGSVIRIFNPKTDPFKKLADTAKVPEKRIARDYTSYFYDAEETPTIYWYWEFNGDTIVDRQTVQRFTAEKTLHSTIVQKFRDTTLIESKAQIFNQYGDVLSNAESFGGDTTYQRAFDYIYDQVDDQGNWTIRRQYVSADPGNPEEKNRILLSRTDRQIRYYD